MSDEKVGCCRDCKFIHRRVKNVLEYADEAYETFEWMCRRYPAKQKTSPLDWCGEFQRHTAFKYE